MPKTLMVGLEPSKSGQRAVELAIRWAEQAEAALVVGFAVLDEPGIRHGEAVPVGASAFKMRRDEQRLSEATAKIQEFFASFNQRCESAGVNHETRFLAGTPWEQIILAAQEFDMVILGAQSNFRFATQEKHCDTLERVVRNASRPVVVVPEDCHEGDVAVVAFDGSLQAARALQLFVAVGLPNIHHIHIVSIDPSLEKAREHSRRAAKFLKYHGIDAEMHPVESWQKPATVLTTKLDELGAGLLVMGAYGEPLLREFFFGSATERVLNAATVPVFLYH